MRKHYALAAGFTAFVLLVAGCGATADPAGGPAGGPASGDQTRPPTTAPATDAVDALQLTGPTQARNVPDMKPTITDAAPTLPATVTDASGETVTVKSADRVLALDLYGALTDTVIGLGLIERLVGRANSDTNSALKSLPVITRNGHDLNTEAVLDLRPDLVFTNTTIGNESNFRQLESAGVTVIRIEHTPSFAAIDSTIELVGQAFGMKESATALRKSVDEQMTETLTEIEALRAGTLRPPRAAVLYVRGTAGIFFILGRDYGAADVLDALGLNDVAEANGITDLKPANAEALVGLNPEIVLAMSEGLESAGGVEAFLKRPGLSVTIAGRNSRVISALDSQLLSYGPRTPASLLSLARAIYTENS